MNYNKTRKSGPIRGGRLSDVVKPRMRRFTRPTKLSLVATTSEMHHDLVQVLAGMGIVLSKTRTMARLIVEMGWEKVQKIEKDT